MTNRMMSGVVAWLALVGTAAQAQVGNQSSHITSSTVTTVVSGNYLPFKVSTKAGEISVRAGTTIGYTVDPAARVSLPSHYFSTFTNPDASQTRHNNTISAMQGNPASIATVTTAITNAGVPAVTATSLVNILGMLGPRPNSMGNIANAIVLYNAALKTLTAAQLKAFVKTPEGKVIEGSILQAQRQAIRAMPMGAATRASAVYSR